MAEDVEGTHISRDRRSLHQRLRWKIGRHGRACHGDPEHSKNADETFHDLSFLSFKSVEPMQFLGRMTEFANLLPDRIKAIRTRPRATRPLYEADEMLLVLFAE
jgi:hypothetical protein